MPTLAEFQKEMKRSLFVGHGRPSRLLWPGEPPNRLSVYRNNVHLNWLDTLNSNYALTRRQFSETQWYNLFETYSRRTPPAHWELNTSMKNFPSFLKRRPDVSPWIAELAQYEAADLEAFLHPWPRPDKRDTVNPTLSVHAFQHQIFFWVRKKAPKRRPPEKKPEVLVFFRDRAHVTYIEEADPLMLLFIEEFKRPQPSLTRIETAIRSLLPGHRASVAAVLKNLKRRQILL